MIAYCAMHSVYCGLCEGVVIIALIRGKPFAKHEYTVNDAIWSTYYKGEIMSEVAAHESRTLSQEEIDKFVGRMASGFGQQLRSPLMHRPSEVGLDYQNVSFPSEDGTPIEGWFIAASGSKKLVIINHPMGFSRSGLPSHLEPWKSAWTSSGNDFEVNFLPDFRILYDAGYNVLCYDLRNFGFSSAANGGISSSGIFESRDVRGSLRYVRTRPDTRNMTVALFSRCLGCNATFHAMTEDPRAFDEVRCLLACQPLNTRTVVSKQLALGGVPVDRVDDLEQRVILKTSIGFDQRDPREWAKNVRVPTLLYQVRDDILTEATDMQTMFDNLAATDKKLIWIDGTTRRWDGYLYFQRKPEQMLEWLESHMASAR